MLQLQFIHTLFHRGGTDKFGKASKKGTMKTLNNKGTEKQMIVHGHASHPLSLSLRSFLILSSMSFCMGKGM